MCPNDDETWRTGRPFFSGLALTFERTCRARLVSRRSRAFPLPFGPVSEEPTIAALPLPRRRVTISESNDRGTVRARRRIAGGASCTPHGPAAHVDRKSEFKIKTRPHQLFDNSNSVATIWYFCEQLGSYGF